MKEPKKKVKKTDKRKANKGSFSKDNQPKLAGAPFYTDPLVMQEKIKEYFNNCPDKKIIITKDFEKVEISKPTYSGLAIHLGFCSTESLNDYEKKEPFCYTVKRARLFIEREYEQRLDGSNVAGAIFALKNFGWKDTQHNINENTNRNEELTEEQMREEVERYRKGL